MRTPVTKEECEQVIYQQRNKLFFRILSNFPAEEVEKLRRGLSKSGEEHWKLWMEDNHERIVAFLRNMPVECSQPLDYRNNALLYCAVLYYFRRSLEFLEFLEGKFLLTIADQDLDEFYRAVAVAAEALDLLSSSHDIPKRWPLPEPDPFSL